MGFGDTFAFYEYLSDDTNVYSVKLSTDIAGAGGFTTVTDPTETPPWPYHEKNLRHALMKAPTGQRTRIPVQNPSNGLYIAGGTKTLHGLDYSSEGIIGEKRKLNSIG